MTAPHPAGATASPRAQPQRTARSWHRRVRHSLGMRLVGQCLVQLRSTDTNFPTVVIFGIPDLERLADTLRECSLRERARRRVTTFVQA